MKNTCKSDKHVNKVMDYVTKEITDFIAFLFILFTLGAIYGWWIFGHSKEMFGGFLLIPLALAALAYYNRDFAILIFTIVIAIVIVL